MYNDCKPKDGRKGDHKNVDRVLYILTYYICSVILKTENSIYSKFIYYLYVKVDLENKFLTNS